MGTTARAASGAPIADRTGKIVSMVLHGIEGEDVLYGLPLHKYAPFVG